MVHPQTGDGIAPAQGPSPGSGGDQERRSRGTTPEQLQRNIAMADGFFKQQHAMQRARAAGEDPYTAIEQHFGMPPTILDTMMPGGPGWPAGRGVRYEQQEDYVPGEGHYTPPGEMPAGSPAGLTRAQLVDVPVSGPGRTGGPAAQVCINGRYYRAAAQPAAHQSSAEGEAAQS